MAPTRALDETEPAEHPGRTTELLSEYRHYLSGEKLSGALTIFENKAQCSASKTSKDTMVVGLVLTVLSALASSALLKKGSSKGTGFQKTSIGIAVLCFFSCVAIGVCGTFGVSRPALVSPLPTNNGFCICSLEVRGIAATQPYARRRKHSTHQHP